MNEQDIVLVCETLLRIADALEEQNRLTAESLELNRRLVATTEKQVVAMDAELAQLTHELKAGGTC